MAAGQLFVGAVNNKQSQVTVANTNLDGTGTLVNVWIPGVNGSILTKVVASVSVNASADAIYLFWSDGTNTYLWRVILIPASGSISATVPPSIVEYIPSTPETVRTGWTLKASTRIGQATTINVFGADY